MKIVLMPTALNAMQVDQNAISVNQGSKLIPTSPVRLRHVVSLTAWSAKILFAHHVFQIMSSMLIGVNACLSVQI